jgi:hypothetical protein
MKRVAINRFFSIVFLTIFFSKMVISIAPVIAAHFDVNSVKAAILQLEIENDSKPVDVKEISVKEYLSVINYHVYLDRPVQILPVVNGNNDHAKHHQPFYPPVPTPPPNNV